MDVQVTQTKYGKQAIIDSYPYYLEGNVNVDGVDWTAEPFSEEEVKQWVVQFNRYFATDDPIGKLFNDRRGHLFAAARIAKSKLAGSPVFAGVEGPSNALLFQELQAWHILRTTGATETPSKSWIMSLTVDEDYWIGYNTDNLSAINIDKELLVVPIAVADLTTNRAVRSLKIKVGDVDRKPIGIKRLHVAPVGYRVPVIPIPTLILPPKETVLGKVYSDAAVTSGDLFLIGLTYGLGSKLTLQYKTTVDL